MTVRFGEFTLDAGTRELTRRGTPVHLSPKAFQLLTLLVDARPAVVERAALRQQLWPDTHVVDAALGNLVAEIRSALDFPAEARSVIRTVHGVGYALGVDAEAPPAASSEATPGPQSWLVWNHRTLPIAGREVTLGRDPACDIWVDAPGVSRRHARLRLPEDDADSTTIEDLASTNGTFVRGRKVRSTAEVHDGDTLTLGDVALTFRTRRSLEAPTRRVRRR